MRALLASIACAAALLATMLVSRSAAVTLAPNDLVVVDAQTDVVVKVDPVSGAQTLISAGGGGLDVAVAPDGTIWVTQNRDVVRIDPDSGMQTVVASILDGQLTGIAVAPSGEIIAGIFGAFTQLISVDPVTGNVTVLPVNGDLNGVAVDAAGDIFVAPELGDQILRLDSTGVLQQTYELIGPPGLDFGRPEDIAFAPDGDLIVLDGIRDVFLKLDTTTGSQTIIDPIIFSIFSFGIAVESSGEFVFPASEDPSGPVVGLWRFDPVTQTSALITSGGFFSPTGLRSVTVVMAPSPTPTPTPATPTPTPTPSPCALANPATTIFTVAKGQSPTVNALIRHEITGNIINPGALSDTAHRIPVCVGTTVTAVVVDIVGASTNTANGSLFCDLGGCSGVVNVKERYTSTATGSGDKDSITFLPQ